MKQAYYRRRPDSAALCAFKTSHSHRLARLTHPSPARLGWSRCSRNSRSKCPNDNHSALTKTYGSRPGVGILMRPGGCADGLVEVPCSSFRHQSSIKSCGICPSAIIAVLPAWPRNTLDTNPPGTKMMLPCENQKPPVGLFTGQSFQHFNLCLPEDLKAFGTLERFSETG